jgi:fibronectin type 3 domain-containing protein
MNATFSMRMLRMLVLIGCLGLGAWAPAAHAQPETEIGETLRAVPQADGDVYLLHTKDVPDDYGFNVYRVQGTSETKLNDTPVRGAQSASAFEAALSAARMERLQDRLDVPSPLEAYYELRADRTTALRFAFTDTTLARQLGYLLVDRNAPAQGEVSYRLEFVGPNGEPTGETLTATATLPGERPAAPTDLEADHDAEQLTFSWSYPTSTVAIPDNVASFRVYRQTPSGRKRVTPGEIQLRFVRKNEQIKRVPVPRTGTSHTFFVVAVDITGQESPPSDTLRYTVTDKTPPAPPHSVRTQVPEGETVAVSWLISPEPDVAGYHVYRTSRVIEKGERLTDQLLPSDSTQYVDSTFTGGGQYIYRVTAVDSAGNESPRSRNAQAFVNDRTPPSSPTAINARFDSTTGRVRLTWQHDPQAKDFAGYALVRRRTDKIPIFSRLDSAGTDETSFVDSGPAGQGFREGARYRYGVATRDESKNLSDTTFTSVRIPNLTPPAAPTRLVARSPDGVDVDLRWTAPPDQDVAAYRLYRHPGDTTAADGMPDTALVELAAPTSFYEDTTAAVGQRYTYRVAAVDSLGKEGPASTPTVFTLRDDAPPRPVRNVRAFTPDTAATGAPAEADTSGVRVVWGRVTAGDLAGYRIYRASIPTGTYEAVRRVGPETTAWTDPSGQVGTWYQVRAIDTSGNASRPSEPAQAVPRSSTAAR